MARHRDADFVARALGDVMRQLVGHGRILLEHLLHGLPLLFLAFFGDLLRDRTLRDRQDRELLAALVALVDRRADAVEIVGDLRDQDDVRAGRDARGERQPADLVAHDFHDEDAAVGGGCRVDLVDRRRRDVDRALVAEGEVSAPDIVVDRLGQMNDVQSLLAEQVGCLLGAVAAQDHEAVQAKLVIILLHRLDLVKPVRIRLAHELERLAGGPDDRAAAGQDAREVVGGEQPVMAVNETLVTLFKPVHFKFAAVVGETLHNAAHRGVQGLAVAAAG